MRTLRVVGLTLVVVYAAAPPVIARDRSVRIEDFEYRPAVVQLDVGDTVLWLDGTDAEQHTVTPDDADAFEGSDSLFPGDTFSVTFEQPGRYPYHCEFHPFMKGTVIVAAPPAEPPTPAPRATASAATSRPTTSAIVAPTEPPTPAASGAAGGSSATEAPTVPGTALALGALVLAAMAGLVLVRRRR